MPLTITTWNVQNFTKTDSAYNDKLNFLVSVLQQLGSDVIALQEILDTDALQDLASRLGFHHVAAEPDGRQNRVAFLARNPFTVPSQQIVQWRLPEQISVRDFDSSGTVVVMPQFSRPALQITVTHGGRPIDIVTAHLKSKLLTFNGNFSTTDETRRAQAAFFALGRRAAEATSIREHVTDILGAGRDMIVCGDFNDGSESATTQILYGPPGSQPHGPKDSTATSGAFQRADNDDGRRLFNVTKLVSEKHRWSRRHNGQNELLDHILASEGLMPRVNGLRQVPTLSILNRDTPNMIGGHPTAGGVMPDHAPVTATFV